MCDIIAMAMIGLLDTSMSIHHIACMVGMYIGLYQQTAASDIIGGIFIAEISNPAMHGRTIIKNAGMRYTKIYEIFEYSFFTFYIFGRCILGLPIVTRTVTCEHTNIFIRLVCIVIALQSYYFVFQMVGIIRNRWNEYALRKKHGIKFNWLSINKEEVAKYNKIKPQTDEKKLL